MTTHSCRFADDRHVRCACGWRSAEQGEAGALESFDHLTRRTALDHAADRAVRALDNLLGHSAEMPADDATLFAQARTLAASLPAELSAVAAVSRRKTT